LKYHPHPFIKLLVRAGKLDNAAEKFIGQYILPFAVNGRIHGEINPHRSDDGGTRTFRFSYAKPPLQQMAKHDEEIALLIREIFLPDEGERWATVDYKQQEFRLVVRRAAQLNLTGAREAAERYANDPLTDFHQLVAELTGLPRSDAKNANFTKIYRAGVKKFAAMIGKTVDEAAAI
jgi:DNA polymerase I-like protein with 3'-5' exonuclease and polymerase domains